MRRVLVTGANKGIGKAIVAAILDAHADTHVLLGSRDAARGEAAVAELVGQSPARQGRVSLLVVDVGDDASVKAAAAVVAKEHAPLYGLVNNAGVCFQGDQTNVLEDTLQVNTFGLKRMADSFLPLLDSQAGRMVNITSASGPMFVNGCSEERKAFFSNPAGMPWEALAPVMAEAVAALKSGGVEAAAAAGFKNDPGMFAYGLSKAAANSFTLHTAQGHPQLKINACTPGFIETDLTKEMAAQRGTTAKDMGCKPPEDGTKSTLHLLFADLEGNGRYYGSDAVRSPLDRYRGPGDPAYTGEN
eukprot:TRINITY_DN30549_c0_g1_i1.p1 TRINITY_DN30549_c0_g1~~TRINITY_DN30549_c0_g1_i1.p1  ORF type:complete len:302 (+),score=110.50 TRINITY_DN30549_c0_g1_i1:40-945(+)